MSDEMRFTDVETKNYIRDQILFNVTKSQFRTKVDRSFSKMSSLDLNLLNSKGFNNQRFELDLYTAK